MKKYKILKLSLLISLLTLSACQQPQQKSRNSSDFSSQELKSHLILNNATLEQSNSQGQTLWKIQVEKATYTPDRKKAQLTNIKGNIFQDGKRVLQVSADKGEVYRDGEEVFLQENILAFDPRNGTTIRSDEVEWRPKQDVLMVRKKLKGSHPKLEASATEGRYYTRKQQIELIGNIVANSRKSQLQLKTEHLIWQIPKEKLIGDRPLKMVRYQDKIITDQVTTNRAEVDIKNNTVLIQKNNEFKSLQPPVQIASNSVLWNYKDRIVKSDQPIKLIHYLDEITITGNQAQVDLNKKIAYLKGGVQGISQRNQAQLYANEVVWYISSKIVEATGNVTYQQAKPKINLTGDKAVGTLQNNNVVVTSNSPKRVVTEIYPN
jgi:LPS export ABC transporter protein LptC